MNQKEISGTAYFLCISIMVLPLMMTDAFGKDSLVVAWEDIYGWDKNVGYELQRSEKYSYDEQGRITEQIHHNPTGEAYGKKTIFYEPDGSTKRVVFTQNSIKDTSMHITGYYPSYQTASGENDYATLQYTQKNSAIMTSGLDSSHFMYLYRNDTADHYDTTIISTTKFMYYGMDSCRKILHAENAGTVGITHTTYYYHAGVISDTMQMITATIANYGVPVDTSMRIKTTITQTYDQQGRPVEQSVQQTPDYNYPLTKTMIGHNEAGLVDSVAVQEWNITESIWVPVKLTVFRYTNNTVTKNTRTITGHTNVPEVRISMKNGRLHIKNHSTVSITAVALFDYQGKLLKKYSSLNTGNKETTLPFEGLSGSICLIRIQTGQGAITCKVTTIH